MTDRPVCRCPFEHDETIVAVVHAGRSMLCHVTIEYDCPDRVYVIKINDEVELDRASDQATAIDLADMFLHGFSMGYSRGIDRDLPPDPNLVPHIHAFEPAKREFFRNPIMDRRN